VSGAAVVYVHGLWMPGGQGALLRRRLQRAHGYAWHIFRYDSVREPMARITGLLRDFIDGIEAPRVHLVGHSLGGLVILRYLEGHAMAQPGRAVFLGTPASGSRAVRYLGRRRWGRRLMGRAIEEELLGDRERHWAWANERELGIIAGTVPLGVGRLLLKFDEDNDGTITAAETRLAGASAWRSVRVSHTGLLLSAQVARETGSFLEHGRFGP